MMFPVTNRLISWRPLKRVFHVCVSLHLSVCAAALEAVGSGSLLHADRGGRHLGEGRVKPAGALPVRRHSFSLETHRSGGETRGCHKQQHHNTGDGDEIWKMGSKITLVVIFLQFLTNSCNEISNRWIHKRIVITCKSEYHHQVFNSAQFRGLSLTAVLIGQIRL